MTTLIIPKHVDNPYLAGTFKHYFVEAWNKRFKDSPSTATKSLPIVMAEALAIMLELIESTEEKPVNVIG